MELLSQAGAKDMSSSRNLWSLCYSLFDLGPVSTGVCLSTVYISAQIWSRNAGDGESANARDLYAWT